MMRALLLSSLLVAPVFAQSVTFSVPNAPVANVDRPFATGIGRYQQWFSAGSLQNSVLEPMRFELVEFLAGTFNSSTAAIIDCELLIGHGKFSGLLGTFDNNWDDTPIVAFPRAFVPLAAAAPGQPAIVFPFATRFTWDRTRPVLIEIRVHGNNQGNTPFVYNFRGTTQGVLNTKRLYFGGSVGAATGTVDQNVGMTARFTARPGVVLPFGTGCAGEGGFVPVATATPVPSPGILWTHQLSNAASQRPALFAVGDTNQSPYPVDLTTLFGLPPSNCMLRTNPEIILGFTTVGGGAGGGLATFPWQLPPVGTYIGLSVFTQWVVLDPLAPNGVVSVSPGIWSIVAPVGG